MSDRLFSIFAAVACTLAFTAILFCPDVTSAASELLDGSVAAGLVAANLPVLGITAADLGALRQDNEALKQEATAILDQAIKDGREMSKPEEDKVAKLEGQIARGAEELERIERLIERRRSMEPATRLPVVEPADTPEGDPAAGFADMAEFAISVMQASPGAPNQHVDERLLSLYQGQDPTTGFHRETRSTDGYEVPPQFRTEIWELLTQMDDFWNKVDLEPTLSNMVAAPTDETTPWGATGIKAYWAAEAEQMTKSKLDTGERQIGLHKLYAFVEATDELIEDAPRLASRLTRKSAQAISWARDYALFYGDGVGKLLGFVNHPATVVVPAESGQTAGTILAENVVKMYSRILGTSMGQAEWLFNSDALPQITLLKSGDNLIWTPPATGIAGAPGGFLMGRPMFPTELCQSVGSLGDLMLVDWMGFYGAFKQGGVQFASSIHLWFDYGLQAFRWTLRIGGQPYLSAPVSPAHGSNTKSHFVALAERT